MSIKEDWDMSVNLNKLMKDVETNPRNYYDKLENNKIKKVDIFANTPRNGNTRMTESALRSLDK